MAALFRAAFDGGSRGNPGPAAWGVAVLDENGTCLEGLAGFLGRATNNVAEYNGLLAALGLARERRARRVELFAENIDRFMTNRPLRNVVDKKAGH